MLLLIEQVVYLIENISAVYLEILVIAWKDAPAVDQSKMWHRLVLAVGRLCLSMYALITENWGRLGNWLNEIWKIIGIGSSP